MCNHDWVPRVLEYYGRNVFEFACGRPDCYETRTPTPDEERIYECGYDAGRAEEKLSIARSLLDDDVDLERYM